MCAGIACYQSMIEISCRDKLHGQITVNKHIEPNMCEYFVAVQLSCSIWDSILFNVSIYWQQVVKL